MKIIHTSDIHLDAAMQSGLTPEQARIRRSELMSAFSRLVEYAKSAGASAVIVAGDLFDSGEITAKVRRFVIDTVASEPNIQFFILFGNHDAGSFSFSDKLPENMHLFSSEWQNFDLLEATVSGVELTGENCESIYSELALDENKTNIVVMHGAAGNASGEDKVNVKLLANRGIDYLALGHYHSYEQKKLDRRGVYAYSGCLEGRGFDEAGEKGFVEITVENGKIKAEFVPFAARQIHIVEADLSGAVSYTEQKAKILEATDNIESSAMLRVVATGALPDTAEKFFSQIEKELKDKFFVFEIKDKTKIAIDVSEYEGDISLKGEFIRLVSEKIKNEDERNAIIACGLSALFGGDTE